MQKSMNGCFSVWRLLNPANVHYSKSHKKATDFLCHNFLFIEILLVIIANYILWPFYCLKTFRELGLGFFLLLSALFWQTTSLKSISLELFRGAGFRSSKHKECVLCTFSGTLGTPGKRKNELLAYADSSWFTENLLVMRSAEPF